MTTHANDNNGLQVDTDWRVSIAADQASKMIVALVLIEERSD